MESNGIEWYLVKESISVNPVFPRSRSTQTPLIVVEECHRHVFANLPVPQDGISDQWPQGSERRKFPLHLSGGCRRLLLRSLIFRYLHSWTWLTSGIIQSNLAVSVRTMMKIPIHFPKESLGPSQDLLRMMNLEKNSKWTSRFVNFTAGPSIMFFAKGDEKTWMDRPHIRFIGETLGSMGSMGSGGEDRDRPKKCFLAKDSSWNN